MPRPPRIGFPDAVYHVNSRGNGRADIFHNDEDRQRFLAQLAHHLKKCAVVLYAYAIMANQLHVLVRTARANLSRFMQRFLSSYALYWRYKHRGHGHLRQTRRQCYRRRLRRPHPTTVCREYPQIQAVMPANGCANLLK
ncbi:MAG: transposase [Rhodopirellula sp.]|nr:transposase [Rhodopirellula sp.]